MAKGKSTCVAWVCTETGAQSRVFWYNKKNTNVSKEMRKFSKGARKHTIHKLKEVKS